MIWIKTQLGAAKDNSRNRRRILARRRRAFQETQATHGCSTDLTASDTTFIGSVSTRNHNERWAIDSNPNLPTEREREMAFLEPEQQSDNSE